MHCALVGFASNFRSSSTIIRIICRRSAGSGRLSFEIATRKEGDIFSHGTINVSGQDEHEDEYEAGELEGLLLTSVVSGVSGVELMMAGCAGLPQRRSKHRKKNKSPAFYFSTQAAK